MTSASGTINGNAVSGLSAFAGADQQFFSAGPTHFTVPGVSFFDNLGVSFNLTSYPDGLDRITNSVIDPLGSGNPTPYLLTSLSVSEVPLPASLSLMLVGVGAFGVTRVARRLKPETNLSA